MSEPTAPLVTKQKRPWALTFFGLLAAAGLIAMPFLAGKPDGEKLPDLVRFVGRFHPVLLHLPIGIFSLILIQELGVIFFQKKGERHETNVFPIFCGAASAIIAALAGFLLYHGDKDGAFQNELVERHLWAGLAFAVAAVFTVIVKAWTVSKASNQAFYHLFLFGSVGIMGFASHDGGSITHGTDYLTKFAPNPIRKLLGLPVIHNKPAEIEKAVTDPVVYKDLVAPMIDRRCVQCHKESNTKGKLRMDTYELLLKGGKNDGPAINPAEPAKSSMLVRMDLPLDDDDHMPPEDKTQLEPHEIAVIRWWIEAGAHPDKKLSEYVIPAPISEAIAKLLPGISSKSATSAAGESKEPKGPSDDLKATVATLRKDFPNAISFESQSSGLLTFTAVSLRGNLDDAMFSKLSAVYPQLVTVDLSATKVTDASVSKLAIAENLRLIRLSETAITDKSIETLLKLKSLESINLYGTKVTNPAILKLAELPNLKRLYLWQTEATPETISAIKQKLPKCEIVTGT